MVCCGLQLLEIPVSNSTLYRIKNNLNYFEATSLSLKSWPIFCRCRKEYTLCRASFLEIDPSLRIILWISIRINASVSLLNFLLRPLVFFVDFPRTLSEIIDFGTSKIIAASISFIFFLIVFFARAIRIALVGSTKVCFSYCSCHFTHFHFKCKINFYNSIIPKLYWRTDEILTISDFFNINSLCHF